MMDKCRAAVCTIFSLASALASTPLWVVSSSDFYFLPFRLCFCARRLTSTSHKHVDRWLNRFLFNSTEQVGLTRRLPSPLSVQKACVKWLKYTYVYWSHFHLMMARAQRPAARSLNNCRTLTTLGPADDFKTSRLYSCDAEQRTTRWK